MKKVFILTTSLRKNGNSNRLAEQFAKGSLEAGNEVETVLLIGKTISFCRGCLACQKTGECVIRDDIAEINAKLMDADVVVFATPVYFYEMAGQMKTLLDRTNPLFLSDYRFRDIYLLATAAEDDERAVDGTLTGLGGWISCFEKASLKGVIRGIGANEPGEIETSPAMREAYEMGKAV